MGWMVRGSNSSGREVILIALIVHHAPTLKSCNTTSWINTGKLFFWELTYSLSPNSSSPLNRTSVGYFLHCAPHEGTSSENPVLFRALCGCELQFYTNAVNTCVMLGFLLSRMESLLQNVFARVWVFALCGREESGNFCLSLRDISCRNYIDCVYRTKCA